MTVRRTHPRFVVDSPWDGVMQVLRDVAINRIHPKELAAVSTAPAVIGEVMSLHLMTESSNVAFRVQVLESRPVVVNGSVRHEIRLGIESVSLMPTGGGLPEAV